MKKQYQTEFINIGTELLLGDIINSNAAWLSDHFKMYGIDVFYHTVVGDNFQRLKKVFETANKRANLVIVTGGLGPTTDDLTREVFSDYSGCLLIEHKPTAAKLADHFETNDEVMTENNIKQTLVFENSRVFDNQAGIAPGMILDYNNTTWIFLPGVPSEMKTLVTEEVLPYLQSNHKVQVISSEVMRFTGIGESKLEHLLQPILEQQTNPTSALLATSSGLILRLTAKANSEEEGKSLIAKEKAKVHPLVENYYYGDNDKTVYQDVLNLLLENNLTIAAAESLTGGRFSDRLIEIPGCSQAIKGSVVCYHSEVKEQIVKVNKDTISNYGTVSRECAKEMALNISKILQSDVGISFTGIAGPESVENEPVGTVWISIFVSGQEKTTQKSRFEGSRESIRDQAVLKGYQLLLKTLK